MPSKKPVYKSSEGGNQVAARSVAYAVTTVIKLGGLVLAGHEALFVSPPRDSLVFALSAFMMAGATGLDGIVDRFLGKSGGK